MKKDKSMLGHEEVPKSLKQMEIEIFDTNRIMQCLLPMKDSSHLP